MLSRVEDSHAADCAVELRDAAAAAEIQLAAALAALTRRLTGTITGTMTVQRELAVQRAVERARATTSTSTCFGAISRAFFSLTPPMMTQTCQGARAHLDAGWCLRSDVMADSRLQGSGTPPRWSAPSASCSCHRLQRWPKSPTRTSRSLSPSFPPHPTLCKPQF